MIAAGLVQAKGEERWVQSYDAGYTDANGAWAGGSEMMHLASHKGKLYASNGYWVDSHWVIPPEGQRQSAQRDGVTHPFKCTHVHEHRPDTASTEVLRGALILGLGVMMTTAIGSSTSR